MTRTLAAMFCMTALCATLTGGRAARADTKGGGSCTPSTDGFDQPAVDCGGGGGDNFDTPFPGWTLPHYYGNPPVLYRVYAPVSGDHLYSIDYNEVNSAIWYAGYGAYEGIIGRCSATQASGQVPLYRFVTNNWGTHHFYTSNEAEKNGLAAPGSGFTFEGVACYIYPSWQSNAACTMYRIRIADNHFYTTDWGERSMVLANGGVDEGYVGYLQCP